MLVPVIGDIVSVIGLLVCTYFYYELPMEVSSISESLFPAMTGTWFAMFTGVYSYVSDVSTEEELTVRVGKWFFSNWISLWSLFCRCS